MILDTMIFFYVLTFCHYRSLHCFFFYYYCYCFRFLVTFTLPHRVKTSTRFTFRCQIPHHLQHLIHRLFTNINKGNFCWETTQTNNGLNLGKARRYHLLVNRKRSQRPISSRAWCYRVISMTHCMLF